MHIGLIGGIGPAATEFYYRGLVKTHAAANRKMALTIAHADTREMVANMERGAAREQAEIFAGFVRQLQGAGAGAVAVTSLGGHFCINELIEISPLPILNAIPALNDHFAKTDAARIGVLGSKAIMESGFYGGVTSVEVIAPNAEDLDEIHATYIAMATAAAATDEQKTFFHDAGRSLIDDHGADVVVLAGTDLFLAFGEDDPGYPVVDSALVHIDAITRASLEG